MLQWGNKQGRAALALTLLGALGAGAAALLARRDLRTAQALAAQRLEENRCLRSKNQALEGHAAPRPGKTPSGTFWPICPTTSARR